MQPVDLSTCDREPIHIPGSIQPHGVLLAVDEDLRVSRCSANVHALLGLDLPRVLGATLHDLFDESSSKLIDAKLSSIELDTHPLYLATVRTRDGARAYDAIAHRNSGVRFVELEPTQREGQTGGHDVYQISQATLAACRRASGMIDLAACIARHIRSLNGFDRVMVYKFDEEWNGEVIAEAKRDDLEPFLNLHYPASDIPVQARALYTKNWLRFITDRDYLPCPIRPASDPSSPDPLDMSYCVLRSVSPIHLEYLRNMGVGASMSISLIRDGKLWGLIACHHYSKRFVPHEVRVACEQLGQVLSLQLAVNEKAELGREMAERVGRIAAITNHFHPQRPAESLLDHGGDLLSLLDAGGAALIDGGTIIRIGQTPGDDDIRRIVDALPPAAEDECSYSDRMRVILGESTLDSVAAGALTISLNRFAPRLITFFRPEKVRAVHWAGDPAKSVVKGEDGVRLSPRGSFALWKQTVQGRSEPWSEADRLTARDLRRALAAKLVSYAEELAHHNVMLQEKSAEREAQLASERAARSQAELMNKIKDDFVATLSHELRTPLNAIIGWTHLLTRNSHLSADDRHAVEVIDRNARVQAQMIEDLLDINRITSGKLRLDVQQVHLPPIVEAAISTVQVAASAKQIAISSVLDPLTGVTVSGDPQRLQQIAWNLLSNSVKFTPKGGRIQVQLLRVNSHVELTITDNGMGIAPDFLPHVFDRFRQAEAGSSRSHSGLGLGLSIVRHLVELHGGTVVAYSEGLGKGSTFTVSLPVRAISKTGAEQTGSLVSQMEQDCFRLNNIRALIVDDELDARDLLRRVLTDCKADVSVATSATEALQALTTREFDVLISDIGMPENDGYTLIRWLREHEAAAGLPKIPAIALTAYARAEDRRRIMLSGFQVHVAKPVEPAELLAVIANLTDRL